eukprot:TRINITY_DN34556_c0_g2_i3.p1 TRINITY_DN34556_c0_g2~~TRINITY_DN34556_c0_g2_i3.p1  ORF type:complete len:413 (-),score=68.45 TRINITY_DN34556_c0_g2_i3:163-1401(-)
MGNSTSSSSSLSWANPLRVSSIQDETVVGSGMWEKYKLGKKIGQGTFGEVRKVRLLSDRKVVRAVKILERRNGKSVDREEDILRQISHRNIVSLYDVYETGGHIFMVLEFCKGGELLTSIVKRKSYYESDAARAAADMLAALCYLHGVSIMHRDIKAQNFLLSDATEEPTIKLIDFGLARRFSDGQYFKQTCGSPLSLAPELLAKRYNHMVDMWAFGVLMYLMMCGNYPFKAKDVFEMERMQSQPIKLRDDLSPESQTFIRGLLQVDAANRLTAKDALKHPFMGLSPQLIFEREVSIASIASVNSNILPAVQSAQLEIEVQKHQKPIFAGENKRSEISAAQASMIGVLPESPASDEGLFSPACTDAPAEQTQQSKYKAVVVIHSMLAVLARGFRMRSSERKVSAADVKPKDN